MYRYTQNIPTVFTHTIGITMLSVLLIPIVAWLDALRVDILQHNWGRLIADIVIAPLGIIHGILMLFSD